MPKVYSEKERVYIKQRLKEEAANCMALYGVRKTTVDEIVKRVNIPKGTFYLFYESKEILMFDALNTLHDSVEKELFESLEQAKDKIDVEFLTDLITKICLDTKNSSLVKIMESGDMELIMRKLPEEITAAHMNHDLDTLQKIGEYISVAQTKDLSTYTASFRGVFALLLFQKEIGEEQFPKVIRMVVRGIVMQLFEEEKQ